MQFKIDLVALVLLVIGFCLVYYFKYAIFYADQQPSWSVFSLNYFKKHTFRLSYLNYPLYLNYCVVFLLSLAFLNPHLILSYKNDQMHRSLSKEGVALYLALDQSSSMSQNLEQQKMSKIDVLKKVTSQFILDHPSDLLGLVSFARVPKVLVPLTLDQTLLIKKLNQIEVIKNTEEDGTAIGYAIFKTVSLISATRHFAEKLNTTQKPIYDIKSAAVIVVTDGFQIPNPLDQGNRLRLLELDEAADYAKKENVHLYIINIDPNFRSEHFAPHQRLMKQITANAKGAFYMIDDEGDLKGIYHDIDQLEKNKITQLTQSKSLNKTLLLYPYFVVLALCCLLLSLGIDSLFLRRLP